MLKLRDTVPQEMHDNAEELRRVGILRFLGDTLVFDREFSDGVLENASSIMRDASCRGSQCETRDAIRDAIAAMLGSRGMRNPRTITLCSELFILEHGKAPVEFEV